jgi:hypothetical protein
MRQQASSNWGPSCRIAMVVRGGATLSSTSLARIPRHTNTRKSRGGSLAGFDLTTAYNVKQISDLPIAGAPPHALTPLVYRETARFILKQCVTVLIPLHSILPVSTSIILDT